MLLKLRSIAFLTFLIVLVTQKASAQKLVRSFKGRVVDSATDRPISDVTISIFRASDTSLINFGFTTPNGNFTINVNNADSLLVVFSQLNYEDYTKKVKTMSDNWDLFNWGDIKLTKALFTFTAKVRKAAISMKEDTMEINASRFKVLPGSDVAQLFKKIPGFEVNVKGEIKVGGLAVDKIMLDGSDFFGNNPGLVSKNLQADMIETVQVYEPKNPDGSPATDQVSKTINLKLKKNKRNGLFGDVLAGYGTNERYEAGFRLNNFKNDRKLSVILNGNNINGTGFDFGFNNWHNAQTEQRNGTGNDFYWRNYEGRNDEGNINNKLNGGFTYFNEFSKKRKLSTNIMFGRNKYNSINTSNSFLALTDTSNRENIDSSETNGLSNTIGVSMDYTKEIDSTGSFEIGARIGNDNNYRDNVNKNKILFNQQLINNGLSNINTIELENNFGMNVYYMRNLRKNDRYYYSISSKYDVVNTNNNMFQFTQNNSDTFNFQRTDGGKSNEWLTKITLAAPLCKKLTANLSADYFLKTNKNEQVTYNAFNTQNASFEQIYTKKVDTLTLNYNNTIKQISIKPYLVYRIKKLYASAAYTFMNVNLNNQNTILDSGISKQYFKTLPSFYIGFSPKMGHFSLRGSKSIVFPTIQDLMPVLNLSNTWQRNNGNASLKPQDKYNISVYNHMNKFGIFKSMGFNFSASTYNDYKVFVNTINNEGIVVQVPINTSGKKEIFTYHYANIKLSKSFNLNTFLQYDYNHIPLFINNQKAFNTSNNFSVAPTLNYLLSDSFDISMDATLYQQNNTNSLNERLNFKQLTSSYNFKMRGILKWGTELSTSLNINDQRKVPNVGKVIPVWNAFIQQPLGKKSNYSIKLSAYDILKQNVNISRSANNGYIFTNTNNQLQQYFLLTLVYKIKKMGGGDDEFNYVY